MWNCSYLVFQYIDKVLVNLQVTEAYKEFPPAEAPIVCSMAISGDVLLTNSSLGMVQSGSPLSYQQPAATRRDRSFHVAPPRPSLPLQGYHLESTACSFVTTEEEQRHLQCLQVSWDMAHKYESATREQSSCMEWHQLRRPRVTASHFREVCHVSEKSEDGLVHRILQGTRQTAAMRRVIPQAFGTFISIPRICFNLPHVLNVVFLTKLTFLIYRFVNQPCDVVNFIQKNPTHN